MRCRAAAYRARGAPYRRRPWAPPPSPLVAHDARLLAVPVTLLGGLALVVQLLAFRDRELQLGDAARVEIELQRHDRQALALHLHRQLVDLLGVQQQPALAPRLML